MTTDLNKHQPLYKPEFLAIQDREGLIKIINSMENHLNFSETLNDDLGQIIEEARAELKEIHKTKGHNDQVICTCGKYQAGNEIVGVGHG